MKLFKTLIIMIFCVALLFAASSCAVVVRKDNGKHRGWFKNRNNPYNLKTTNPQKYKGKKEEKSKGRKKMTAQADTIEEL